MKKLTLLCSCVLFIISCRDSMEDIQEYSTGNNYVELSKIIEDSKSWFYNNYTDISRIQEIVYPEIGYENLSPEIKKTFNGNPSINGNLDWEKAYLFAPSEGQYFVRIPIFNYEVSNDLLNYINPYGYRDLLIKIGETREELKSAIIEVHPDKEYVKSKLNIKSEQESFIDYRKISESDSDFTGYVLFLNPNGKLWVTERRVNGKIINQ